MVVCGGTDWVVVRNRVIVASVDSMNQRLCWPCFIWSRCPVNRGTKLVVGWFASCVGWPNVVSVNMAGRSAHDMVYLTRDMVYSTHDMVYSTRMDYSCTWLTCRWLVLWMNSTEYDVGTFVITVMVESHGSDWAGNNSWLCKTYSYCGCPE